MMYLKESNLSFLGLLIVICFTSCVDKLPEISPTLISEQTLHDTDDPAIWIHKSNSEESLVFGTDKDEINGGIYAFNLDGEIVKSKSITGLSYPNNVDIAYDFKLNDSTKTDILIFTEREKNQIRLFSIPDMKPLDNGGFSVFEDETDFQNRRPMGIALYSQPISNEIFAIVSRKIGPLKNYLYQYQLVSDSLGVRTKLVRTFGDFSGKKEIEAIAVDNELGFVYYSDEMHCIRKYYADPRQGDEELGCFGSENFKRDIEGISIAKYENDTGFLIVSDQQAHSFSIFDRKTNTFIKQINLGTTETDGCEVTTVPLGNIFSTGLFVSMNDDKTFYFHDLNLLNLKSE
jgi:3-phytase